MSEHTAASLNDLVWNVSSREDLIQFLEEMRRFLKENPARLENDSVDLYLDALTGAMMGAPGLYKNFEVDGSPNEASWFLFAWSLWSATIHE